MDTRKGLLVAALALVLIIVVLATLDRQTRRENVAATQQKQGVTTEEVAVATVQGKSKESATPSTPVAADTAVVDTTKQKWVKVPGTGIALWPKP